MHYLVSTKLLCAPPQCLSARLHCRPWFACRSFSRNREILDNDSPPKKKSSHILTFLYSFYRQLWVTPCVTLSSAKTPNIPNFLIPWEWPMYVVKMKNVGVTPTSQKRRFLLCTMVHKTGRWCKTQVDGAQCSCVLLKWCTTYVPQMHLCACTRSLQVRERDLTNCTNKKKICSLAIFITSA